ncbi:uncharacterized protein LOC106378106 [Brassica napus]|uniref:uncharacterized protein LOC106378106 n=1 Tax=Brassica napus TaxID=3708 RepID=UPI0006AAC61E|nr:uncharacterized protein LOC106378106 [Brassica napus]
MSLDDEEPLVLPDSPQYTVIDSNETSLLGRLLNPDCQSIYRMIEYMPTAWRVVGRVKGIALSRDRWNSSPPDDFLSTLEIWIRIRNIPVNNFTSQTMHTLASEIGHVEEIAYDPKVSHTKEYIRAKVTFKVDSPAKATRKLSIKNGGTVTIECDYEKIHKRCFHCLRLTHEKVRCPLLRNPAKLQQASDQGRAQKQSSQSLVLAKTKG